MVDSIDVPTPSSEALPLSPDNLNMSHLWERIALGAVMLLSVCMNFFQLGQNGYGNLYYASGVKSMGDSWQNFFFVSFDPGGFVSIDKPPLGFWLQTLSTKVFGFSAFSLFFPQALCGVLTVLMLYVLVRHHFGAVAGLVASLALVVTPISAVTSRNNTIDTTLALVLVLAAGAVILACERGKLRWLLLSAVCVGLGFNIKMAEAFLVVPALAMTYLLCAPQKLWLRLGQLVLAGLVMVVISLSWAVAVDMTPATQRPYVGSTPSNSAVDLATGYNGFNRLRIGGANGTQRARGTGTQDGFALNLLGSGPDSPLRLFSPSFGGQIAWLLPFAMFGMIALLFLRRPNFRRDRQQLALILWGFWLLTMVVFFTLDASFHQYYMTELSPGLCALVGIGLVVMWQEFCGRRWTLCLLPLALVATAAGQIYIVQSYPLWSPWLGPLIGVMLLLTVVALVGYRLGVRLERRPVVQRVVGVVICIGLLGLLIAPTLWSGYSVINNNETQFPTAGPNPGRTATNNAGAFAQVDAVLLAYLEANQGHARFLVATTSSTVASVLILHTNRPVMAMGGYGGGDPILTVNELQRLVSSGVVRFFLISQPRGTNDPAGGTLGGRNARSSGDVRGQAALSTWIIRHCSALSPTLWSSTGRVQGGNQLYDCARAQP